MKRMKFDHDRDEKRKGMKSTSHERNDDDVNTSDDELKRKPSISFCKQLRVVLVPCRQDYRTGGVSQDLWWQPGDYTYFKDDAKAEIFEVMKTNDYDPTEAIQHLYHDVIRDATRINVLKNHTIESYSSSDESTYGGTSPIPAEFESHDNVNNDNNVNQVAFQQSEFLDIYAHN